MFLKLLLAAVLAFLGWMLVTRLSAPRNRTRMNPREKPPSLDLSPCAVCGAYVGDDGPKDCDRADCPYSG